MLKWEILNLVVNILKNFIVKFKLLIGNDKLWD